MMRLQQSILSKTYYTGRISNFNYEFDTSKPSGFPRRVMDLTRAKDWINYNPTTSLSDGLKLTWEWFQENQEEYLNKQNYFK